MLKRFNNATSKVERSSAEASIEAEIKKLKADAEVAKEIENGLSASEIKKINPDSRASSKLMLALELSTDFHKVQLRLKSTRLDSAQAQTSADPHTLALSVTTLPAIGASMRNRPTHP